MKKIVGLGMTFALVLGLAACGDSEEKGANSSDSSAKTEDTSSKTDESSENKTTSDTTFEDASTKIVIKNTEELTNKYDASKKILAIEIEYTNKGETAQSPWFAFASSIKPIQESEQTEEILNGANGQFPDDYKTDLVKMGDTDVKSGETVEAVVGVEILYPGSPIMMTDFTGNGSFEKTVDTTK